MTFTNEAMWMHGAAFRGAPKRSRRCLHPIVKVS